MAITVHGTLLSPPVRAVLLVCEALGIEYEMKSVNVGAGEHRTQEYAKLNPLRTIPTIQDGDFTLYESHAIVAYLADTYGKQDRFFPKDPKKRALVNARLHFNNSYAFARAAELVAPVMLRGELKFAPEHEQRVQEVLQLLDAILGDALWVAEDEGPTIADCCLAATVESIKFILPGAAVPPRVAAWLSRCEEALPRYDTINKRNARELGAAVQGTLRERAG